MEVETQGDTLISYLSGYKEQGLFERYLSYVEAKREEALLPKVVEFVLEKAREQNYFVYYQTICAQSGRTVDEAYVTKMKKEVKTAVDTKEGEIQNYKNLHMRESVYLSLEELGKIYRKYGMVAETIKTLTNAREWADQQSRATLLTQLFEVYFLTRRYSDAESLGADLDDRNDNNDPSIRGRLLQLLVLIRDKNFQRALDRLEGFNSLDDIKKNNDLLTVSDFELYYIISALNVLSREDFLRKVEAFTRRFGLKSAQIDEILEQYRRNNMTALLPRILGLVSLLKFDLYLASVQTTMTEQFREKVILQYLSPFRRVSFAKVAEETGLPVEECRKKVTSMIERGQLSYLINPLEDAIEARESGKLGSLPITLDELQIVERYVMEKFLSITRLEVGQCPHNLDEESRAGGGKKASRRHQQDEFAGIEIEDELDSRFIAAGRNQQHR
eukprot:TRINITY_DN2836_c0_g1_i4.p1 TRINITY_DN2836_c0_g1~~TRINITY_DN2836_c0_g1_i4.p1  ORF type:complete len:445 (-),score=125.93 TRINITY_DN2836_c0_g1_i4:504-1838(-)